MNKDSINKHTDIANNLISQEVTQPSQIVLLLNLIENGPKGDKTSQNFLKMDKNLCIFGIDIINNIFIYSSIIIIHKYQYVRYLIYLHVINMININLLDSFVSNSNNTTNINNKINNNITNNNQSLKTSLTNIIFINNIIIRCIFIDVAIIIINNEYCFWTKLFAKVIIFHQSMPNTT